MNLHANVMGNILFLVGTERKETGSKALESTRQVRWTGISYSTIRNEVGPSQPPLEVRKTVLEIQSPQRYASK